MVGMKKHPLFLAFAALSFVAAPLFAEPLEVGADAPKVQTVDQKGNPVDLAKELATGLTLVYFYPKADTPGCTKQACNLRDAFEDVKKAGIKVFGVSADTPEDQLAFAENSKSPSPSSPTRRAR